MTTRHKLLPIQTNPFLALLGFNLLYLRFQLIMLTMSTLLPTLFPGRVAPQTRMLAVITLAVAMGILLTVGKATASQSETVDLTTTPDVNNSSAENSSDTELILGSSTSYTDIYPLPTKSYDKLKRFEYDVFKEMADRVGFRFQMVDQGQFRDILPAVTSGKAQFGMGLITVTPERLENDVDFLFPHFFSGQTLLLVSPMRFNAMGALSIFLKPAPWQIMFSFVVLIFIFSHIVWILERGRNTHDPIVDTRYYPGIVSAFWMAASLLLRVPFKPFFNGLHITRVLSVPFGLVGIAILSLLIAFISTQFWKEIETERHISLEKVMTDIPIVVQNKSASAGIADKLRFKNIEVPEDYTSYIKQRINKGELFGIVDDRIDALFLKKRLNMEHDVKAYIHTLNLTYELNAFAVNKTFSIENPELIFEINEALQTMYADGTIGALRNQWVED